MNKPFKFTTNWTEVHTENWNKALKPFIGKENIKLLEIGLYEGQSTNWFLNTILTNKTSELIGVDIRLSEHFNHNLNLFENKTKVTTHTINSFDFLIQNKLKFDIIYVDGSHKGKNVLEDVVLSWSHLNMNGIMILDDYNMFDGLIPHINRPKLAIDTFLNLYRDELIIHHKDYQVIIEKKFRSLDEFSIRLNNQLYLYIDMYNDNKETALYKWLDETKYEVIETEEEVLLKIITILNKQHVDENYTETEERLIKEYKLQEILGL